MDTIKNNKVLLITGGTGSFGNAVLKRILHDEKFSEVRIFSRDEKKQDDMRHKYDCPKIKYYIGDVREKRSLDIAMKGADYVFHAAALKQVPSCEFFPMEAVKTNILGAQNAIESAIENGIRRMILLSTDKAVYPINAMGVSKAMMEKLMQARARTLSDNTDTILCGTRYGNVMATRGSVIPLFIDQIKSGADLTITDPSMTRFMMTLDDAVDLVFYTFLHGENGDMFVQKSPASTIADLATALLDIFSSTAKLKIIGTRHGEKLYETLVNREEMARAVDLGDYYRIPADNRDLNYSKYFSEGEEKVSNIEDYHSHNTKRLSQNEVKELLMNLEIIRSEV